MGRGPISMRQLACRGRLFPHAPKNTWAYLVLASLSASYPSHRGRLSTCYAPVRRFTRLAAFSRDLHVLGTPPAFVLSQDQTLQLISIEAIWFGCSRNLAHAPLG